MQARGWCGLYCVGESQEPRRHKVWEEWASAMMGPGSAKRCFFLDAPPSLLLLLLCGLWWGRGGGEQSACRHADRQTDIYTQKWWGGGGVKKGLCLLYCVERKNPKKKRPPPTRNVFCACLLMMMSRCLPTRCGLVWGGFHEVWTKKQIEELWRRLFYHYSALLFWRGHDQLSSFFSYKSLSILFFLCVALALRLCMKETKHQGKGM